MYYGLRTLLQAEIGTISVVMMSRFSPSSLVVRTSVLELTAHTSIDMFRQADPEEHTVIDVFVVASIILRRIVR